MRRVTRAAREVTSAPLILLTLLVGSDLTSGCRISKRASNQPTRHGWLMLAVGRARHRPFGISDQPSRELCSGSSSVVVYLKKTSCEDDADHRREPLSLVHGRSSSIGSGIGRAVESPPSGLCTLPSAGSLAKHKLLRRSTTPFNPAEAAVTSLLLR
jgi:hypothetical protein